MPTSKNKVAKGAVIVFALMLLLGYVIFSQSNHSIRFISGTKSNACINNLRQIDGAKQQWAIEQKKDPSETPTSSDLTPYIKTWPTCPGGGTFTINAVSNNPTCTVREHALP